MFCHIQTPTSKSTEKCIVMLAKKGKERYVRKQFLPIKKGVEFSNKRCKIGHCHCVILPPALLASLKMLSSIIKAKNVLDLELFTQRRSCSRVTKLWLEEVARRPPPSNWRHSSLGCCCDWAEQLLICESGEGFKGTCQYWSVEWLDL